MVPEPLNPYASPTLPAELPPNYEQRTIVGQFVVDELTQRDAARGYRLRHVFWLASTLGAIPVTVVAMILMAGLFMAGPDPQWIATAVVYGFIVGSFATVGLHVALDWSIFFHNLRQLRRHAVLGAVGPWQVMIDEEKITIATSRGQQAWPLEHVRRMELNQRPIVLWLEPDVAVALPKYGDYGEDDYPAVRKTLRRRITHVGGW
jgi:hypothetical protein